MVDCHLWPANWIYTQKAFTWRKHQWIHYEYSLLILTCSFVCHFICTAPQLILHAYFPSYRVLHLSGFHGLPYFFVVTSGFVSAFVCFCMLLCSGSACHIHCKIYYTLNTVPVGDLCHNIYSCLSFFSCILSLSCQSDLVLVHLFVLSQNLLHVLYCLILPLWSCASTLWAHTKTCLLLTSLVTFMAVSSFINLCVMVSSFR